MNENAPNSNRDTVSPVSRTGALRPTSTTVMPDGSNKIPLGSGVITAFLGQGGMANVYEIWNGQLEVYRAVKLVNPNCNSEARERFQTEMKISAKLHHANITEIYGTGYWNDLPYIEMERLSGVTLDTTISQRGALPPSVATSIGIMVGRALKYAHSQQYQLYGTEYTGVVHRDLKPSNLMIGANGTVKLMDFGIASPAEASFHTIAGTVLGTLQYLAPEQLECQKLTPAADIYALCTTLYEVLTGVMAFPEHGVHKLMLDKLKGKYKPLDSFKIKIPSRLKHLIHRCMDQEPSRRIQSAGEMLAVLGRIHSSLTSQTPEQVMTSLLATPPGEKIAVATRFLWPERIAAGLLGALGAGTAIWYVTTLPSPVASSVDTVTRDTVVQVQTVVKAETVHVAAAARVLRDEPVVRPNRVVTAAVSAVGTALQSSQPTPAEPSPRTLVETMAGKHGTEDILEMIRREHRVGQNADAFALFEFLPADKRSSTEAQLYRLRILQALGKRSALADMLERQDVSDGEFVLAQARIAYEQQRYADALRLIERGSSLPRLLMSYEQYVGEAGYCKAQCATALFDQAPADATYKDAMDAWFQLRSLLRTDPGHRYNKIIIAEMQRIGQKFRQEQGGAG